MPWELVLGKNWILLIQFASLILYWVLSI
ncbi:hypothetical protein PanWU01x14_013280 [Parasponia andersonii]|uniref:Uncharacterized protein n=1 Tax=Parasponia andersonii TaxID=3476 RepID=A0A2P5E116_PARAD|nr:hypothetical protein PanWU01x14_013280 [Parasponia andersonii]